MKNETNFKKNLMIVNDRIAFLSFFEMKNN